MDFLIQTIDQEVRHDFAFHLCEAVRFQNWLRRGKDFGLVYSPFTDFRSCVPIGSVEFVSAYLLKHYEKVPLPRNVPESLFSFAKRDITNGTRADIAGKRFVKSNDQIKSFTEIVEGNAGVPEGNYQISEVVPIESEYRAFVFKKKLVGIKHYSGDFAIFPDLSAVEAMIQAFTDAPVAYTLDVGISAAGTFVLEVHDFFSCGLYGFSDATVLPFMFSQWFSEYTRR